MVENGQKLHICDDWISVEIAEPENIPALCETLRALGYWTEVTGGLNSLAVQFDPNHIDPVKAAATLKQQLSKPTQTHRQMSEAMEIPVCYDPAYAPDLQLVAEAIRIPPESFADWHGKLQFTVAMIGFMPGFAYLKCDNNIPDIGRLSKPRQNVTAGSIGIIGDQSCIYSFDSPGGWPIIGRSPSTLFDPTSTPATLLSAGQKLRFVAISPDEYAELA